MSVTEKRPPDRTRRVRQIIPGAGWLAVYGWQPSPESFPDAIARPVVAFGLIDLWGDTGPYDRPTKRNIEERFIEPFVSDFDGQIWGVHDRVAMDLPGSFLGLVHESEWPGEKQAFLDRLSRECGAQ